MPKKSLIEELDRAVEAMVRNPGAPLPEVDSRIAQLVRIAANLRDLATDEFRARLQHELLRSFPVTRSAQTGRLDRAEGVQGPAVEPGDSVGDQQNQITRPELEPRDTAAALDSLKSTESASLTSSVRVLASLDQCLVGVARSSDQTPLWKRNLDTEELLHVLEGELDVTSLTDDGPIHTSVSAGSIFVCPRGRWHWQRPSPAASLLFVTPERGTEYARGELPRKDARHESNAGARPKSAAGTRGPDPEAEARQAELTARNINAALSGIPVLAISENTTGEEAAAAFPQLGSLNQCGLYVGRFSGLSPWERHTSADELLHVLEGELEITTLTDAGPVRRMLRAGNVFVCPRGLWHRQYSAAGVLEFSATPQPTEVSFAQDPRA